MLVALAIIAFVASTFFFKESSSLQVVKIPSPIDGNYKAFGDKLLYYNGNTVYCLSDTGATRWSYDIGMEAGFDCSDDNVVLWAGSNLYILDKNGNATFTDNLGTNIIYAHVGKQFMGVVLGDDKASRLSIRDHKGIQIDEEADAFMNDIILDFGFFGDSGEFLWTLKLDTDSTAPNTILNTFEVGKMNTGEVSLGEYITYEVLFENARLRTINTRRMNTYDYRVSRETAESILIYGWQLIDSQIPSKGDGAMLFAPSDQLTNPKAINELRLVIDDKDNRYTLPMSCIGAIVNNNYVYAIANSTIYKASANRTYFNSFPLDLENGAPEVVARLSNGKILVSDGIELFMITLP